MPIPPSDGIAVRTGECRSWNGNVYQSVSLGGIASVATSIEAYKSCCCVVALISFLAKLMFLIACYSDILLLSHSDSQSHSFVTFPYQMTH